MSRARPHYFPDDTPEPVAQPYSAIDELLQLVSAWLKVAGGCFFATAVLAYFFPSVFTLFR
ncbi:hypothetical protein J2W28_001043 [Variovorax boronicumulans]|uniref:hypothetical protein n=1 Tax=Variovorax boronicumulans TaxID=436515 RepID=UPI002780F8C6|nr:hypothetical protein [Variovorax boronicumulans]MDP9992015.1 hypothetical protein [Variovorax boronicumulans]MDQ0001910.1 hypothetical protein [Variovorax boronicumulans]